MIADTREADFPIGICIPSMSTDHWILDVSKLTDMENTVDPHLVVEINIVDVVHNEQEFLASVATL